MAVEADMPSTSPAHTLVQCEQGRVMVVEPFPVSPCGAVALSLWHGRAAFHDVQLHLARISSRNPLFGKTCVGRKQLSQKKPLVSLESASLWISRAFFCPPRILKLPHRHLGSGVRHSFGLAGYIILPGTKGFPFP